MEREYKNTNSILSERMPYNCTNDCNAFCNIQPVNSLFDLSFQFFPSFLNTNKNVKLKILYFYKTSSPVRHQSIIQYGEPRDVKNRGFMANLNKRQVAELPQTKETRQWKV